MPTGSTAPSRGRISTEPRPTWSRATSTPPARLFPSTLTLRATSSFGSIKASTLRAGAYITTSNARVDLSNVSGSATVRNSFGTVTVDTSYVDGARNGVSMSFREDGTKSTRMDYKAGKETGQAAWDEQGKLLFAHGTAQQPGTK